MNDTVIDIQNPDYAELKKSYHPSIEAIKFIEWQKQFANEVNKSSLIHYLILDSLFSSKPFNVLQCSRGVGKTTTAEYAVIYGALFGKFAGIKGQLDYCLFLGDAEDNGVKQFIENVYLKITGNDKLNALIQIDKKVKNELVLSIGGRKFWLVGRGAKQSPRGTKRGELGDIRPQLLIADDVTNEDDAKSEIEREEIKTRFNRAFLPALDPNNKKVILIGTPQHEDDIILTKMRNSEWNRVKLPICNTFTSSMRKEDFVGAWEDRFSYETVMDIYKQYQGDGDESGFMQEYMLELMDDANRMFKDEDFVYYKYSDIKGGLSNMNFYIACDFNAEASKKGDYGVIIVIGVTNNNDWMVVDGIHTREYDSSEWINYLFKLCSIYDPLSVGMEKIAFQSSLIQWIRSQMITRNQFFNIDELKDNNNKAKITRISTLAPRHHLKKIMFPSDHCSGLIDELTHEMKMTTKRECKARHDDCIDCLSNFTQMGMISPGKNDTQALTIDMRYYNDFDINKCKDSCIF